ncbi:armadillo-type protein [Syncephalastrum racemosum]|uniref:Armadillo-type protein n=1 Tax=Syncephalastrum racemosum TaxID=13706 RepID=A0A1X2HMT7_SYNRA|nr:armadillo-type protein [Syncephalastrum racemosum]
MTDARTQLLHVLHEAASQDISRMSQAEQLLKQWESEASFFATLQDIFYDPAVPHDVRFLSGIYLKNGVARFWRKTAPRPIDPQEKAAIRQRLLQFLNEPSKKLTAQNAIIVARIARIDYPMEWPDLLPSLIQAIESTQGDQEMLVHDRALEILVEVLQELSTRLLSAGRRQFTEVAPRVFQTAANLYVAYTTRILDAFGRKTNATTALELEIVATVIKCLRILMVNGIRDVHKYDETKTFIDLSRQHLQEFVRIYDAMVRQGADSKSIELLSTVIEDHGTLYLNLLKKHPVSCALVPAWTDILNYYWQSIVQEGQRLVDRYKPDQADKTPIFEPFLLQGMLLVKDTIKNTVYSSENASSDILSTTEEEKALVAEARNIICQRFITQDFVSICAETLVTKYMLLTPEDFDMWEDDPEGWAQSIDSENWEFELRPCAEVTFMSLLTRFREELCPILLSLVDRVTDVSDYQALLFKDAVYAAIGLGVQSIYGRFDFEVFVSNRVMPEIANKDPTFKVLRRRIAWLLGKWVNEGISSNCRITIYEALLDLMREGEDMVVRLTAAHSLRLAIDDWDFEISIVLPYLGTAMDLLLNLLNQVEEPDTVMKLIHDLNAIMDRTGEHMVPYAARIIELLVPHWSRASENPLFQSALVVTFTKITGILKEESSHVHGLYLPIVSYCIDRNNQAHVYLLEDALDLWWTLLQTATAANQDLFTLVPAAIGLLDYDTDSLRKVLRILESYLLLDANAVIQQCGLPFFQGLANYIGSDKTEVATSVAQAAEMALQSSTVPVYGEALLQSGLLHSVIRVFLAGEHYAHVLLAYMSVLARLAVCDAAFTIQAIRAIGQSLAPTDSDFLGSVLDQWMDKFDNIGHSRARKLTCVAFTRLLSTCDASALARLPGLMAIWTDVLAEVKESEEDAFFYTETDLQGDLAELDVSAEKDRRLELRRQDAAFTTDLGAVIRHTLSECERHAGGAQAFQEICLSKVDPTLLDKVRQALTD